MRKLMLMGAMLAMAVLAASPVYAQTASQEATVGDNSNISQQLCQNIVGDLNAAGVNDSAVDQYATSDQYGGDINQVAEVAQENNVSIEVVQICQQQANQQGGDNIAAPQPAPDEPNAPEEQYETPDAPVDEAPVDETPDAPVDEAPVEETPDAPEGETPVAEQPAPEVADDVEEVVVESGAPQQTAEDVGQAVAEVVVNGNPEQAEEAAIQAGASQPVATQVAEEVEPQQSAVAVLPDTGGASLFTLGAGALLVAGGLLARRIVR